MHGQPNTKGNLSSLR